MVFFINFRSLTKPATMFYHLNGYDGAHSIGVQNVTSNWKVATLISVFFSLYLARRLASGETFIR